MKYCDEFIQGREESPVRHKLDISKSAAKDKDFLKATIKTSFIWSDY